MLRLIALDRVVHFIVLAALGVGIILFAANQKDLRGDYLRLLSCSSPVSASSRAGTASFAR